ncbi:54S ribosomal protein L1 mitochondrial [Spathaspora sp. JA1]|nr:54S ribosomal protein L1 mitochondrial [Spathaspora sp. JA1]
MFKSVTTKPLTRSFSITSTSYAPASKKPSRKSAKVKQKKYNSPVTSHPLYMEIPQALRYLRAFQVGQPLVKQSIYLQLSLNQEKGAHPLNGSIQFPHPVVEFEPIVFTTQADKIEELKKNGVKYVGGAELIEQIKLKEVSIDSLTHAFATPEIVDKLKPVARMLGPKGLLPNVKKGTVTDDINKMFQLSGQLPFKQKDVLLNCIIGNCNFSDLQILENLHAASKAIYGSIDPKATKKTKVGIARLHTFQSPGIAVEFEGLQ